MSSSSLSRRDLLRFLLLVPWLSALGRRGSDWFARERVCVHVYRPRRFLPAPLFEPASGAPPKRGRGLFAVGLPELVVLSMTQNLVDMFPYFWPLSRSDFREFDSMARKGWAVDALESESDLQRLRAHLEAIASAGSPGASNTVVALTLNDVTRHWAAAVLAACRDGDVSQLVVFKDPSVPPYLCELPALQKGFKRPPP